MKSILLLPVLLLGACSGSDHVFIKAHGHRCFDDDPKTMNIRIRDNGASYNVAIYRDFSMQNTLSGCELTVDKKSRKIVKIMFSQ